MDIVIPNAKAQRPASDHRKRYQHRCDTRTVAHGFDPFNSRVITT
jgi:hypothetical protein